ncbi:hypothetical protein HPB50_010316 [Hyalomma asiaticum]|uniref:Uncharacterized protein n=1 Tax=Hyalomma asiaticum TaxID=266040 RepID=A0ACB7TFB1_HYAAI|nr:hypothetical protein HPB50_010316 [Hyalomma asiaticum]
MAKDLETEVHTTRDAVLWLWRAHNKVNARLAGDISEDPLHPKRPFPPPTLCSDCHEGTRWNEQHSLNFLLRFYASDGLVPVAHKPCPPSEAVLGVDLERLLVLPLDLDLDRDLDLRWLGMLP